MKNSKLNYQIIALAIICFLLSSCSSFNANKDDIVKKNAEEHLKSMMNDPSSYEFVELTLVDSTLISDNLDYYINDCLSELTRDSSSLQRALSYKVDIPSLYDEKEVAELNEKIGKNLILQSKLDSLKKAISGQLNNVASYTYSFTFRGNNAMGGKVINKYIVQTDTAPHFKILKMSDDMDKLYLTPNGFPGLKEVMN